MMVDTIVYLDLDLTPFVITMVTNKYGLGHISSEQSQWPGVSILEIPVISLYVIPGLVSIRVVCVLFMVVYLILSLFTVLVPGRQCCKFSQNKVIWAKTTTKTRIRWKLAALEWRLLGQFSLFHYYTPTSTKLKGGYTGFTLSVCPSVDRIVSALYLCPLCINNVWCPILVISLIQS